MRKLIMWNIITIDGYFEGSQKWDLSFHNSIWGPELEKMSLEQLRTADYLIFGRITYEGMAAYWTSPEATKSQSEIAQLMNRIPKLVFSTTLQDVHWSNTTLINDNAVEVIHQLKNERGKNLYVFGSANLSSTFIEHDLFDEYRIGISPVILGDGNLLFKTGSPTKKLSLASTQPLASGGVILTYCK